MTRGLKPGTVPLRNKAPEIIRLDQEGLTREAIAKRVGVTHGSVYKILARARSGEVFDAPTPPPKPRPPPPLDLAKKAARLLRVKVKKQNAPKLSEIQPGVAKRLGQKVLSEEEEKLSLQVRSMVSTKTEISAMADMVGLTTEDFRRKYRSEMTRGHGYVYAAISQKLVQSAVGGDMRAMLAWLRQFGGWQEVTRKELTGKDGAPISIRSLDGPSLFALMDALGTKRTPGRNKGRAAPQIDYSGPTTDLDSIPGTADESPDE